MGPILGLLLADLIANRTRSLAGRLAGSLAFAAAAGMYRLLQGSGINGNDVLCHKKIPPLVNLCVCFIYDNTDLPEGQLKTSRLETQ